MKMFGIAALALMLMLGISSAANIIHVSDEEAIAKKMYVSYKGQTLYVGGPVKGYLISGYVPYVCTGKQPAYKEISTAEYIKLRS